MPSYTRGDACRATRARAPRHYVRAILRLCNKQHPPVICSAVTTHAVIAHVIHQRLVVTSREVSAGPRHAISKSFLRPSRAIDRTFFPHSRLSSLPISLSSSCSVFVNSARIAATYYKIPFPQVLRSWWTSDCLLRQTIALFLAD